MMRGHCAHSRYVWNLAVEQHSALRDFMHAMTAFLDPANPAGRPTWRKAGQDEGFRVTGLQRGDLRRLSRHVGEVRVPKVGWVRFRWSRAVPARGGCRAAGPMNREPHLLASLTGCV
jgi:putative transposase